MKLRRLGFVMLLACHVMVYAGCGGGSGASVSAVVAADAGAPQSKRAGMLVTLDGSKSIGAIGKVLTYHWVLASRPDGSNATLSDPNIVNPTFTPDLPGIYKFDLTVNDGTKTSSPSTVTITISNANSAPIANAGSDLMVRTGKPISMNGSNSNDADADLLTYSWTFVSKPSWSTATLSSTDSPTPAFTPDVAGTYVLSLKVNDGYVESPTTNVTVTAVSDLSQLFSQVPTTSAMNYNDQIQAGSVFTLTIKNLSNETFLLNKAEFTNGGVLTSSTTSPSLLNNNLIGPGQSVGVQVTLGSSSHDDGFKFSYYLTDPVTGQQFVVSSVYDLGSFSTAK